MPNPDRTDKQRRPHATPPQVVQSQPHSQPQPQRRCPVSPAAPIPKFDPCVLPAQLRCGAVSHLHVSCQRVSDSPASTASFVCVCMHARIRSELAGWVREWECERGPVCSGIPSNESIERTHEDRARHATLRNDTQTGRHTLQRWGQCETVRALVVGSCRVFCGVMCTYCRGVRVSVRGTCRCGRAWLHHLVPCSE